MATQTGSIDLTASNAVKLAAEASVDNKLTNYATHAELTVSANNIKSEVAETYATKDEAALELDGSGKVVVLDEAADARLKALTIHGLSVQDGTPTPSAPVAIQSVQGRNLMGNLVAGDYSDMGITCIVGEDNKITFGGTATSGGNIIIPLEETVPYPTGTVYWHYRNDAALGNMTMALQPALAPYNGPNISLSPVYKIAQGTNTQGITTIGSVRFYIQNGQTYSTVHLQPSIEYASNHTAWTPYGSISLASRGKNLLELNKTPNPYSYGGTAYYVDFTVNGSQLCPVVLEEGVTYTLSMNVESSVYPTTFSVGAGNGTYAKDIAASSSITQAGRFSKTFTPTAAQLASGNIFAFRVPRYNASTFFTAKVSNIQLEIGSTATAYEPYNSTTTPIDLQGTPPPVVPPTVSLGNGNFITTDSYEDFTKDFCLFVAFVRAAASRHCFASPYNSLPGVGIELNTSGLVRVFSVADTGVVTDKSLGTAVGIGSQCRFALMWSATAKTYTWLSVHDGLRETGTFAPSGSYTGTSTNPLRMGGDFRDSTGGKSTFPNAWTQWNMDPYFEGAFPENYASMMWYYNGDGYSWTEVGGYKLRSLPDGTHDECVSGETADTLVQRITRADTAALAAAAATPTALADYVRIPCTSALPAASPSDNRYRGLCNVMRFTGGGYASNTLHCYTNGRTVYLYAPVGDKSTWTAETAAEWITEHNVEVIAALADPVTTTLPHVDLPIVHDGDSVWVDAQVTPNIDVAYWSKNGETVSALSSTLTQTAAGLELELSGKVDSDEEWVSWMHAGTDATTHEPYLAMGQDSDYPSVVYGSDAARFYDGEGDADSNVVASFGADGAVVGNVESSHTSITPEVTAFHDANGNEAARISMSDQGAVTAWASYSVNPTTSWTDRTETGITPLPDFTLGDLELTVSVDGEVIHSYSISSLTEPQISVTYGDIDIKFQATKSGDTWTAAMSCRNRDLSAQPTVTFGLSWEHIGTAPMWKFGGATNQGAYSFSAGDGNQPTGEGAVTLGLGLTANRQAQVVVGKHNKPYQSARFIVGSGTDDAGRSNALAVTDQGIETVGYIQTGGTVGLGSEAQQAWQTALGINNLFHFETIKSAEASINEGAIREFTAVAPSVDGMTCRGIVQTWYSGSGNPLVGASWRTSADETIHARVRANSASTIRVWWLLLYTPDFLTTYGEWPE